MYGLRWIFEKALHGSKVTIAAHHALVTVHIQQEVHSCFFHRCLYAHHLSERESRLVLRGREGDSRSVFTREGAGIPFSFTREGEESLSVFTREGGGIPLSSITRGAEGAGLSPPTSGLSASEGECHSRLRLTPASSCAQAAVIRDPRAASIGSSFQKFSSFRSKFSSKRPILVLRNRRISTLRVNPRVQDRDTGRALRTASVCPAVACEHRVLGGGLF